MSTILLYVYIHSCMSIMILSGASLCCRYGPSGLPDPEPQLHPASGPRRVRGPQQADLPQPRLQQDSRDRARRIQRLRRWAHHSVVILRSDAFILLPPLYYELSGSKPVCASVIFFN